LLTGRTQHLSFRSDNGPMDSYRRHGLGRGARVEPSVHADRTAGDVISAAIAVHRVLGPGLLESTYETALAHELSLREIPHKRQVPIVVRYRDIVAGTYEIDLLVDEVLLVELKVASSIADIHIAQALAYLAATRLQLGLILNFGQTTLRDGIRRVVRTHR
jgi:GxxExxY protein